jgi:hypothetical protein
MRPSVGIGVLVCASAVVLAGIVAASGCTVLTNDSLPDDAGKYDGSTDGGTPVCATCLAQECTGQLAVCFDDPACVALAKRATSASCAAGDGGPEDGGADPLAVYAAFAACGAAKAATGAACATDCTGATLPAACGESDGGVTTDSGSDAEGDGGTNDAGVDDAASDASIADAGAGDADAGPTTPTTPNVDTCTSCVSGECGDAKKACAIGSECAAYLECTYAAADVAAAEQCGAQFATGKAAATELATCTRVGCNKTCGF